MDETLLSANSIIPMSQVSPKWPTNAQDKIKVLVALHDYLDLEIPNSITSDGALAEVFKDRNLIAHGKCVGSEFDEDPRMQFVKVNREGKIDGVLNLRRQFQEITLRRFREMVGIIHTATGHYENLRSQLWSRAEGWPNYLISSETEIFALKAILAQLESERARS